MPDGLSKESLDNALLLFRYDHDYRRHRNKILPPMYSDVYSEEVNEPHYHFNSSFGSLYGLSDKPKKNNVGAGYAISVTELINYLRKLRDAKPTDFISNNDYGMPFLHYKKSQKSSNTLNINDLIKQYEDVLDALILAVSAKLGCKNGFQTIPANPSCDSRGLKMQMVFGKVF